MSSQQSYGQVKAVRASASYRWDINQNTCDFYNKKYGKFLKSPIFSVNESLWRIILYPNSREKTNEGYLEVFLKSENASNMQLEFIFSIKNNQNDDIEAYISNEHCLIKPWSTSGFKNIIRNDLLPIKFSILCEIIIDEESCNKNHDSQTSMPKLKSLEEICKVDIFENLLNNEKYSDFKFMIDGKDLYVHKNILAVRSKHFERMFEHETRTEDTIEDIKYDVFYEVLRFLYTGKISQLDKYTKDILVAANKYNLQELKIVCENKIIKKLTTDNVIEVIKFADTYNAEELKKEAIKFVVSQRQVMKKMPEFKSSLKSLNEDLYDEVIFSFIMH